VKRLGFCFIFCCSVVLLSGCGGGSSDSGVGAVKSATPFAGQYSGFEALILSGPGITLPVGTFPISISIDANGGVVVTDIDGTQYLGMLGNPAQALPANQFVATALVTLPPDPGISCQPYTFGFLGTITGDAINGSTSGNIICTSQGMTVALTVGGPFWATRIAGAAPGVGVPSAQPPTAGGRRKSEKLQAIAHDIGSLF
jgi:hypothetical protein